MRAQNLLFLVLLIISTACQPSSKPKTSKSAKIIEQLDFMKWWTYHNENIRLSRDFVAFDENFSEITKASFLQQLTYGDFIPRKLKGKEDQDYYQLHPLGDSIDADIIRTIRRAGVTAYRQYQMEGQAFPEFEFTDLNGKIYNNENTRGKTIVIKCWFIACQPCVAEIPHLNVLVEEYQNNEDILFISLASDSKEALTKFLEKQPFSYAVVPGQSAFMTNN